MWRQSVLSRGVLAVLLVASASAARAEGLSLQPCRLDGVEHEALCGKLRRPLDPSSPKGAQVDIHVAVLPALARNKKPDPVVLLAGGPGQSAIGLAGMMSRQMARVLNRRDVVLVDQRGTGRSAPLQCPEGLPTRPVREWLDPAVEQAELDRCRQALQALPHGDLRQYTTTIAMADLEAVRQALGAPRVNLVGASYGTRAALEYVRQFPQAVRRVVIDGVAPPDMALPQAFSTDNQQALDALLAACEADARCRGRYPRLRAQWAALLDSLPRPAVVTHPVTGVPESVTMTRDIVLGMVRMPLYVPGLASALPHAMAEASAGRFGALLGLAAAMGGARGGEFRLAMGLHFSVVCAEDLPRLGKTDDRPGADFGTSAAQRYERLCASWPRGEVPAAFYQVGASPAPVLVLSGGVDPVTPPRHGQRVAAALGPKARHVVVPQAGHGVMGIGCMRDVVYRFIDAATDDDAKAVDAACAQSIPRPTVFLPVRAAGEGSP
jgi:pimeloyl-ACP methyl ester carboxylesterase